MRGKAENRELAPLIEVRDVVKRFSGKTVVDNLSFNVFRGETFAFLGPNGSGKTTTIKMLTALLRPDQGQIIIDGFDVRRDPLKVRQRFGVVFQDTTLDTTMTIYENLWMHCAFYHIPRRQRAERIQFVLGIFDLNSRKDDFVSKLSGGLKRRAEIARALLHEPALIFLDEPTLGLDPQSRRLLWDHLKFLQEKENITVFLTTHYLDEVERFATSAAIVERGKIITHGSVEDITLNTQQKSLEDSFLFLTDKKNDHRVDL